MNKKIPLSQGKFAIVGPRDYTYLTQWGWFCHRGYAVRHNNGHPGRPLVYMHRVILERMGFKDFAECDHINHARSDNRRCNLRPVSRHQNNCNHKKQRNNTSGYIGVNWRKDAKKWTAMVKANGKQKHLGYFDDKEEARRVRDEAAKKYYGEFANLNKE